MIKISLQAGFEWMLAQSELTLAYCMINHHLNKLIANQRLHFCLTFVHWEICTLSEWGTEVPTPRGKT